jgi:Sec-independent protein secretion pathway component TatC
MLNIDETLTDTSPYIIQRDLYLKSFVYSFTVIIFVDILRSQVSEVNLLQLIPGFYLILLFLSLIYLVFFSNLVQYLPFTTDNNRTVGTKTTNKMQITLLVKFSFFLLFTGLILVFNSVIPLSLDSFNNYDEKTLESLWSFDEVLTLEITLFIILSVLSQIPVFIVTAYTTERDVNIFPEFWKGLSLMIFLVSGLLTPTIDGYTQLSFAGSTVSLYLIIISVTEKKVNIKFPGTAFLGS